MGLRILRSMLNLGLVACTLAGAFSPSSAQNVFVTTSLQQFGLVDLSTGLYTDLNPGTTSVLGAITVLPNGTVYGLTDPNPGDTSNLFQVNTATGALTTLGPTNMVLNGLASRNTDGALFTTDNSSTLFALSSGGGTAQIGAPGIPNSYDLGALAYGANGGLYNLQKVGGVDNVYLRDTISGGSALVTFSGPSPLVQARGLVSGGSLLYAFDDTAHTNEIFSIDTITGTIFDTGNFVHTLSGGNPVPIEGFIDAAANPSRTSVPEPSSAAVLLSAAVVGASFFVRRRTVRK